MENQSYSKAGPGGDVITFEQGIIWDNGRMTDKWLHDSWVKSR